MRTYASSDSCPALCAVITRVSRLRISALTIHYSGSEVWDSASVQTTDGLFLCVENTTESSTEETSENGGRRKAPIRRRLPQD